jgi:hypothetical protein
LTPKSLEVWRIPILENQEKQASGMLNSQEIRLKGMERTMPINIVGQQVFGTVSLTLSSQGG